MVDNLIVGSGNFKFKVIQNWEKLPVGFSWRETAAVIADIEEIYMFSIEEITQLLFLTALAIINLLGEKTSLLDIMD